MKEVNIGKQESLKNIELKKCKYNYEVSIN